MSERTDWTGAGRAFIERTKYAYSTESAQQRGEPQPPLELPYDRDAPLIALPDASGFERDKLDLHDVITARRTYRNYTNEPVTLGELAYLLWCTQGIKSTRDSYATLRTVPSAGARHAFETYLLVNNVTGLEPGVYRYIAGKHSLLRVPLEGDLNARITRGSLNQQHVARSAVTFIWVAITERMTWRYGERGYRYLLLDAGHVCQNLYLAAEPIGCGVCALAAFDDDLMNEILQLDGEAAWVIYMATLGKRQERRDEHD